MRVVAKMRFGVISGKPDARVCVQLCLLIPCASACVVIKSKRSGMVMILADEMQGRSGDNIALTLIGPVSDRRGVWLCRHGEP